MSGPAVRLVFAGRTAAHHQQGSSSSSSSGYGLTLTKTLRLLATAQGKSLSGIVVTQNG